MSALNVTLRHLCRVRRNRQGRCIFLLTSERARLRFRVSQLSD